MLIRPRHLARWSLAIALPLLLGAGPTVRVVGRASLTGDTPIVVEAPSSIEAGEYTFAGPKGPVGATCYRDSGRTWLAIVLPAVFARDGGEFHLEPVTSRAAPLGITLDDKAEGVDVAIDGKPFTTYRPKPGPKPYYFPLVGPTGDDFTRSFPMREVAGEDRDHPHHRSLWFTHGAVNGVDFWTEGKGHGSIVETSRQLVAAAPVLGQIRTTDDWVGPDGKVVLTDERVVRAWKVGDERVLDFDILLRADHGPVVFGDTKEGTFGLRVASTMDVTRKTGGKIVNAEGTVDDAAWGKPSPWVEYSGPIAGKTVGIAILDHPSSFRHPTTWHVRTYGLFAANPFGYHDFGVKSPGEYRLEAGGSVRFAYRVILHEGEATPGGTAAAFETYARPPEVTVTAG